MASVAKRAGPKGRLVDSQERRRAELLRRQRDARRNLTDHARQLALGGGIAEAEADDDGGRGDDAMDAQSAGARGGALGAEARRRAHWLRRRDYWSAQLTTPEWMLQVPSRLNGRGSRVGDGWYVLPRPEGRYASARARAPRRARSRRLSLERRVRREYGVQIGPLTEQNRKWNLSF